jgi:hypothetical protein
MYASHEDRGDRASEIYVLFLEYQIWNIFPFDGCVRPKQTKIEFVQQICLELQHQIKSESIQ